MFDITLGQSRTCDRVSRRQFLRVGALAPIGLSLPALLQARAENPTTARSEMTCILLWMQGGPSHLDMFDPKPDAPAEIRGEFDTIPTTLPGVRFGEHLPRMAKLTDLYSVIRGHNPENGSHGVADHLMMSGRKFNPSLPFACYGSVVAKERGFRDGMFPFVQLGRNIDRRFNGGVAGFLGDTFNPFEVHDDPNAKVFQVRDLSVPDGKEQERLERRYAMLDALDGYDRGVEAANQTVQARDTFYEKAHGLITSPAAKKAFDIEQEPARVRDNYGRDRFGQSCLLARRLIEAGVQFVTVTDGGWDTHQKNFASLKDRNLPRLDAGLSALLEDLHLRGMLDTTMVVWMGDFGRTPKINPSAGRDHWATAGSVIFAGAGLQAGQIVGRTNPNGEFVTDSPVTPQDIAATVYHTLGVPLDTWYQTPDGRPIELVQTGKPVRELVG